MSGIERYIEHVANLCITSQNTRCTWSRDGKLFLFVSTSGHVIATPFNPNNTEPVPSMSYSATASPIYAVETDPSSKYATTSLLRQQLADWPKFRYFALGCGDSLASLWEMREMTCLRTFGTGEYVRYLTFSFEWLRFLDRIWDLTPTRYQIVLDSLN